MFSIVEWQEDGYPLGIISLKAIEEPRRNLLEYEQDQTVRAKCHGYPGLHKAKLLLISGDRKALESTQKKMLYTRRNVDDQSNTMATKENENQTKLDDQSNTMATKENENQTKLDDQSNTMATKENENQTKMKNIEETRKRKFQERKKEAENKKSARGVLFHKILGQIQEEENRITMSSNNGNGVEIEIMDDLSVEELIDDLSSENNTITDLVPLNNKGHPMVAKKVPRVKSGTILDRADDQGSDITADDQGSDITAADLVADITMITAAEKYEEICKENAILKTKLSAAYREMDELRRHCREQTDDIQLTIPKPGILNEDTAKKHKMVELLPGSKVYLYQHNVDASLKIGDPHLKGTPFHGKRMAKLLMNVFFEKEHFSNGTLSPSNKNGKQLLNLKIVDTIINFSAARSTATKGAIRHAISTKLTSACSKQKKTITI